MQERCNSIANALELHISYTNLSICPPQEGDMVCIVSTVESRTKTLQYHTVM